MDVDSKYVHKGILSSNDKYYVSSNKNTFENDVFKTISHFAQLSTLFILKNRAPCYVISSNEK